MSFTGLALLWVGWVVAGGSPGPATLALASTGMARGRKAALALAAGIMLSSSVWGIVAAVGLGALMLSHAWIAETLRYAGAAYILWLAFKSLRSALKSGVPKMADAASAQPRRAFVHGVLLHATNPKAMLAWGAVFSLAVAPGASALEMAGVWLFLLSGSVFVFFGYALLFSTAGMARRYAGARRWFEAVFGLLFGGAAVAILTARVS
ncbi:MAG: LysE family translocator [Pikeienuella sp.]